MTYEEYFKHWDEATDKALAANFALNEEILMMLAEQHRLDEEYPEYKARLDEWVRQKAAENDARNAMLEKSSEA